MHGLTREKLFIFGMYWRMIYGVLRSLIGLTMLNFLDESLLGVVNILMAHELVEDPNDVLYTFASFVLTNHPVYISYFIAFYFIFWGIIDILLSYNLLKRKLWAFPLGMLLIGCFLMYEVFRYSHTHSLILLGVIIVDAFVFWIVWKEWGKLQNTHTTADNSH